MFVKCTHLLVPVILAKPLSFYYKDSALFSALALVVIVKKCAKESTANKQTSGKIIMYPFRFNCQVDNLTFTRNLHRTNTT